MPRKKNNTISQETVVEEKLTAIDPFKIKFVLKKWNRPETVAELIKVCDILADEWDGIYQIDRGGKGSLSGIQTNRNNIFDDDIMKRFPVLGDLKKMCQQMTFDWYKANPNFEQPKYFGVHGWFNKLGGEDQHQSHSHGSVDLVINFYLSCPIGKDRFNRECPTRICFMAPIHLSNCPSYLAEKSTAVIVPKVGEMIASPSMYIHYVPATHSKEWRRSISINIVRI